MKLRSALLAAALSTGALAVIAPAPAEAASPVRIYRIYYNSPGSDTRTNASLNGEWVQLKNYATSTRTITGWTVRDVTGYLYKFPTTSIPAGKTVILHTGKGANTTGHRYWQRTAYVWNNDRDTARLRNGAGTLMHSCSYSTSTVASKYC